jgi:CO/xanthine dehydrogenase FAD-binding subunit
MSRYLAPTRLEEALAAVAGGARPVAGGTDLVVGVRQGRSRLPEDLVSLHRLDALRGIEVGPGGGVRIGAGTSHAAIVGSATLGPWPALADGAAIVGSAATRAWGTLGGNVANASPAADTVAPLIVCEAVAVVRSAGGERRVEVERLATGPRRTSLRPDELIVAFELPPLPEGTGSCYVRLEYRRQMEIAVVGAAALVTLEGGRVSSARVAIAALAPTIRRVAGAEEALVGSAGDADAVAAAGRAAAEAAEPIDDVRATADYRRAMAAVVARRAITGALRRARGEPVAVPASASLFGVD